MTSTFFGLEVQPRKLYKQVPPRNTVLHVSQVSLPASARKGTVSVQVCVEEYWFTVCTLEAGRVDHWKTDLNFSAEHEVQFCVHGELPVHLTGFYDMLEPSDDIEDVPETATQTKASKATTTEKTAVALKKHADDEAEAGDDGDDGDDGEQEEEEEEEEEDEEADEEEDEKQAAAVEEEEEVEAAPPAKKRKLGTAAKASKHVHFSSAPPEEHNLPHPEYNKVKTKFPKKAPRNMPGVLY